MLEGAQGFLSGVILEIRERKKLKTKSALSLSLALANSKLLGSIKYTNHIGPLRTKLHISRQIQQAVIQYFADLLCHQCAVETHSSLFSFLVVSSVQPSSVVRVLLYQGRAYEVSGRLAHCRKLTAFITLSSLQCFSASVFLCPNKFCCVVALGRVVVDEDDDVVVVVVVVVIPE